VFDVLLKELARCFDIALSAQGKNFVVLLIGALDAMG
jgi:hypothetical protein